MEVKDKVAIVTGGANGIGRALCRRLAAGGARGVVVADKDERAAMQVAEEIGGLAVAVDVSVEADSVRLVEQATARFGPVDLFCSNAGIGLNGGPEVSNADWERIWQINVMAHVYAARAVLPEMLKRGEGYLLNTASAGAPPGPVGIWPLASATRI